ncbi:phospholipase D family protein [Mariniflexile sp.]|uniref:phospholipase D family protein n=1 Tax=Mariniflexile sp. TaxID=1979402 RepID=UPI00356746C2
MAKFITGNELIEEVYDIIYKAKKQLLIVSPYIKLDGYFKNIFDKHKKDPELHLIIAFGKNPGNPQKSLKKEDLNYFKDFPNASIIYVPNLHAKYYANESRGVITSINLYDYSFENNVEFGVISETKIIGGTAIDKEAWDSTIQILKENYSVFIRRPRFKKKMILGKNYMGSEDLLDFTDALLRGELPEKVSVFNFDSEIYINSENETERISRDEFLKAHPKEEVVNDKKIHDLQSIKCLSATNLGKIKDKSFDDVIDVMVAKNYIYDKQTISPEGEKVGIKYNESKNGNKWIVYPEFLSEIL